MKLDILAIGVHPDDVELSAAGTLLKHIALGKTVGILDLTLGELGTRGTAVIRTQEAMRASEILGVTVREQLNMADGFFENNEAHQKQILNEQLKKVADEGLPLNEMVILSPRKFENSCVKSLPGYSIKEIKTANEVSATQKYFGFATVQSYKGMEGNYILITDIEDLSSEVAKSLLYVGMSRARYGLILLISEEIQRQYYDILQNKLR